MLARFQSLDIEDGDIFDGPGVLSFSNMQIGAAGELLRRLLMLSSLFISALTVLSFATPRS